MGDQVLGRGKLYFERFADGTKIGNGNERYMGNTPAFTTSRTDQNLDHFSSDEGLKQKDITVTLESTQAGSITFDEINKDNVALMFSGVAASVTQTADSTAITELRKLGPGMSIQIGASSSLPLGVRGLSEVTVKDASGTTTISPTGNFTVDLAAGRITVAAVPTDATDLNGTVDCTIAYKRAAGTYDTVISGGTQVYGALRFISYNAYGKQRDYYFPYVKLTPEGDFSLKGDAWLEGKFALEILKRDDTTERVYSASRLA